MTEEKGDMQSMVFLIVTIAIFAAVLVIMINIWRAYF